MQTNQLDQEEIELIQKNFHFKKYVGKGSFGKVIHVQDRQTKEDLAIKIIPIKGYDKYYQSKIKNEAKILKKMNHQNIVQYKGIIKTKDYILILMEYVKGGSLGQLIRSYRSKNKKFTSSQAAKIMLNIFRGVAYLHSKEVVHRDLKPDNILIEDPDDFETIKLADLGLAEQFVRGSQAKILSKRKGTLKYMAPEQILNEVYTKEIDIFACGIIMYLLLAGFHPLYVKGDKDNSYIQKLNSLEFEFPSQFPTQARLLFLKLVKFDAADRYSAQNAYKHPWVQQRKLTVPKNAFDLIDLYEDQDRVDKCFQILLFLGGLIRYQKVESCSSDSFIVEEEKINYQQIIDNQIPTNENQLTQETNYSNFNKEYQLQKSNVTSQFNKSNSQVKQKRSNSQFVSAATPKPQQMFKNPSYLRPTQVSQMKIRNLDWPPGFKQRNRLGSFNPNLVEQITSTKNSKRQQKIAQTVRISPKSGFGFQN